MFPNYRDSDSRPPSGDITGRTQYETGYVFSSRNLSRTLTLLVLYQRARARQSQILTRLTETYFLNPSTAGMDKRHPLAGEREEY